jgi:hypothetical protein
MGNPDTNKSESTENRDAKTSPNPLAEATSDKTVSDLEENEDSSDSKSSKPSDERSIPSPDGSPDPDRGSGGSDAGGPM